MAQTDPAQRGRDLAYEARLLMCARYGELQQTATPPEPFPTYEQFLEAEIARLRGAAQDTLTGIEGVYDGSRTADRYLDGLGVPLEEALGDG